MIQLKWGEMKKYPKKPNLILLLLFIYSIFIWNGCAKDGEEVTGPQPPSSNLTGVWSVQETINGNCPGENYPINRTDIFIIVQTDNDLEITLSSTGAEVGGTISANKISWQVTVPEGDGETKINFSGTVSDDGQTVSGEASWIWSNNNFTCSGQTDISASKVIQPIVDITGKWDGDWQSSTLGLSGPFSADITQQGSTLSGSITISDIGINNAELQGTVAGNTIVFGDINSQITFVGVLEEDSVSASGTYYYSSIGDYGIWQAEKGGNGINNGLQILQSFPIPGDDRNKDMTYDGTNLWVLAGVDKIYKFSTAGNLIATINSAGSYPVGLAFNGEQLLNADSRWGNSKIFKLDISGSSIVAAPGSGTISGLTNDGSYLWAADNNSQNPQIYKIEFSGAVVDSFNCPGSMMKGLTYDGSFFWLSAWDNGTNQIYKLDLNGNVLSSFEAPGFFTGGLTFDGVYLWYSDNSADKIYQLDTLGTIISTIDAPCQYAGDMAFDGTYLWVVDEGVASSYKLYQIDNSGIVISSIETPGSAPSGLTYSDGYLWNCNYVSKKIYRISILEEYFSKLPEFEFQYLTHDGTYLWADDISAGKIHKFNEQGEIIGSIDLPCSQIGGFVYSDSYLWIVGNSGFSFEKLYQVDLSGNIEAAFQASQQLPDPYALTTDGVNLWYIGKETFGTLFYLHKLGLNIQ